MVSLGVHRVNKLIPALSLIADLKGLFFRERRVDQEANSASGFEHGTVTGMLRQKRALGLAARPQANSRPARVGKETDFHLRSIAPPPASDFGGIRSGGKPAAKAARLRSAARRACFGCSLDRDLAALSRRFRNWHGYLEHTVLELGLGLLDVDAFRQRNHP